MSFIRTACAALAACALAAPALAITPGKTPPLERGSNAPHHVCDDNGRCTPCQGDRLCQGAIDPKTGRPRRGD
jgi:hypothetical protein